VLSDNLGGIMFLGKLRPHTIELKRCYVKNQPERNQVKPVQVAKMKRMEEIGCKYSGSRDTLIATDRQSSGRRETDEEDDKYIREQRGMDLR
jgi:hypothetical protein